jgi:hypothetical protein
MQIWTALGGCQKTPEPGGSVKSITKSEGKCAYPIASLTWIVVPDGIAEWNKKDAIRELLN